MDTGEEIRVTVSDYILTPLSCSYLINEILKGLMYQKCQIPYSFSWLKSMVNRRRAKESEGLDSKPITKMYFTVEKHYRFASKFLDNFQSVMKEISLQLSQNVVSEILILFGPTPVNPREVCRIKVPLLASGHFEDSHINDALRHQHKVLRQIFLSNIWIDYVDSGLPCTNTYIFIKKDDINNDNMKYFKPCKPPSFHDDVKLYCINLKWECTKDQTCCKNLVVYNEIPDIKMETSRDQTCCENLVVYNEIPDIKMETSRDQTCCKNLVVYNEIPDIKVETSRDQACCENLVVYNEIPDIKVETSRDQTCCENLVVYNEIPDIKMETSRDQTCCKNLVVYNEIPDIKVETSRDQTCCKNLVVYNEIPDIKMETSRDQTCCENLVVYNEIPVIKMETSRDQTCCENLVVYNEIPDIKVETSRDQTCCENLVVYNEIPDIKVETSRDQTCCKNLVVYNEIPDIKMETSRDQTCCKNLVVYNEIPDIKMEILVEPVESKQHVHLWYQFTHHLKGFRNCFINKTAVCELW